MGYTSKDIFESKNLSNKIYSEEFNLENLKIEKTLLINLLTEELNISKKYLIESKNDIEKEMDILNSNISSLQVDLKLNNNNINNKLYKNKSKQIKYSPTLNMETLKEI